MSKKSNYVLDSVPEDEREGIMQNHCAALLSRCRECNYKFTADDTANEVKECPECSALRGVCNRAPLTGKDRCKRHGGAALVGQDSPLYKHGRYSKVLPTRLKRLYEAGLSDADLLNLNNSIALIEAVLLDEVKQLDEAGTDELWPELDSEYTKFRKAMLLSSRSTDANTARRAAEDMQKCLINIEEIIKKGYNSVQSKKTIISLVEQRRKLTSTEVTRREKASNTLTKQEVTMLISNIANLISQYVTDPTERKAVVEGLRRLMPSGRVEL